MAKEVAERIRKNIEMKQIEHQGSELAKIVTVSVGVATMVPSSHLDLSILINNADQALYKAKHQGRNRVEVY